MIAVLVSEEDGVDSVERIQLFERSLARVANILFWRVEHVGQHL